MLLRPILDAWLPLLKARRELRERARAEACDLPLWLGDHAYAEARSRARAARSKQDRSGDALWTRVAVLIAKDTRRRVGETVADRYEQPNTPRSRAQREIIEGLVDISQGIAEIAKGHAEAMASHNLKARVLQIADRAGGTPAVAHAAAELCHAIERLAGALEENRSSLAAGVYPAAAEKAGAALQRFRNAINTFRPMSVLSARERRERG